MIMVSSSLFHGTCCSLTPHMRRVKVNGRVNHRLCGVSWIWRRVGINHSEHGGMTTGIYLYPSHFGQVHGGSP